jgi:hypothetical protein
LDLKIVSEADGSLFSWLVWAVDNSSEFSTSVDSVNVGSNLVCAPGEVNSGSGRYFVEYLERFIKILKQSILNIQFHPLRTLLYREDNMDNMD